MTYQRELQNRIDELSTALKTWSPRGGEQSFQWYKRYIDSGYQALPFAGGVADQPVWWWDDVSMLDIIGEKYWLPSEVKRVTEALKARAKR